MCRLQAAICYLPAVLVIWSSAAFVISFLIAVFDSHVAPFIPFISDTGTFPPESCIFGLMINISAFLGALTMYARYKELQTLIEANPIITSDLNRAALVIGLLGCIGMCVVANFQETAVRVVHDIGALLAFGMGTLHLVSQAYISFKMLHLCSNKIATGCRLALSAVSVVAFIPMIICYFKSGQSKFEWNPTDEAYGYHVTSAACEWIVAFCFNFFFLTYIKDFQKFTLNIKTEILEEFRDDSTTTSLCSQ